MGDRWFVPPSGDVGDGQRHDDRGAPPPPGLGNMPTGPPPQPSYPPPSAGPGLPRWAVALVVVAVVVFIAVVAAALVLPFVIERSDDAGEDRAEPAELAAVSGDLVGALQRERDLTSLAVLGIQDALNQADMDVASTRRSTDDALDELEAATSRRDTVASHFGAALDAVAGLARLRSEIDGREQTPSLAETGYASDVFDRYTRIIDAVLDESTDALLSLVDDPELRGGIELLGEGWRQVDLVDRLGRLMLANLGVLDDAESVREVASLTTEMTRGQALVGELASGTGYEGAADQLAADLEAAGLAQAADDAARSGLADLARVTSATTASAAAWHTFLDAVEDGMRAGAGNP